MLGRKHEEGQKITELPELTANKFTKSGEYKIVLSLFMTIIVSLS